MCRCRVAVGGCLGRAELHGLFVWNGSHHSGWRLVSEDPSQPTAAWSCLPLAKGSRGDGCWPETAAALVFLGADSLAGGLGELAQPAQTCCPSSRFGGTRGILLGPTALCRAAGALTAYSSPCALAPPSNTSSSLPACPLKTLPLPPASYQQSSYWFNLLQSNSPHWKVSVGWVLYLHQSPEWDISSKEGEGRLRLAATLPPVPGLCVLSPQW